MSGLPDESLGASLRKLNLLEDGNAKFSLGMIGTLLLALPKEIALCPKHFEMATPFAEFVNHRFSHIQVKLGFFNRFLPNALLLHVCHAYAACLILHPLIAVSFLAQAQEEA